MDLETILFKIHDEQKIKILSVTASLNDGMSVPLSFIGKRTEVGTDQNGIFTKETYLFTCDVEKISLEIQVKIYKDLIIGTVRSSIEQEEPFFRQKAFDSKKGISIAVHAFKNPGKILGFYHFNDWWTRPVFLSDFADLPARTQSVLWKNENRYFCLVPIVSESSKTEISGNEKGFSFDISPGVYGVGELNSAIFAIRFGKEPFELVGKTFEAIIKETNLEIKTRVQKSYPEIFNYLGWCSWDAFYHEVNEKGIIDKLSELKEKNVPVKWLIIDDGWQDVREKKLKSLRANPIKFPKGLAESINIFKETFGIRWVGVWHTLFGYWGGIDPESRLADEMKDFLHQTNGGKLLPAPDTVKGFGFWNLYHGELKRQGVDFVKVDCQGAINNFYSGFLSHGKAALEIHTGLEASIGLHFDQAVLNCMGMAAENIWYRPASAISRNSDDFVPGKEISFKEHALQNVYNSLFHSFFYWGDWDMFWTNHEEDLQSAVLRALSGGPIYFSDRVGNTDPSKLRPLIYSSGKIIRGENPGLPTEDMLFVNPNRDRFPLKVWNKTGDGAVLGMFNIDIENRETKGTLSPSDIPHFSEGTFAIFDYFYRKVSLMKYDEQIPVTLQRDEVRLFTIIPYSGFRALGLVNKYLSLLTVKELSFDGNRAFLMLAEGGTFAFLSEERPKEIIADGKVMHIVREDGPYYECYCPETETNLFVEIRF